MGSRYLLIGVFLIVSLALLPSLCAAEQRWGQWQNSLKPKGEPAPSLTLADSGRARYRIVIPAEPDAKEQKAAEELAYWLNRMTDAEFPIVRDTQPPVAREISIGRTSRLAEAGLPVAGEDLGGEGYAIAVQGERLFLLGGTRRGPLNAVYCLLEEDLGIRWYTHGVNRVLRRPTVVLRPVARRYVPQLTHRSYQTWTTIEPPVWVMRNRVHGHVRQIAVPEELGGDVNWQMWSRGSYAIVGHTFHVLADPRVYFEEHPEYYALIEGQRVAHGQLCLTNPEVVDVVTRNALELIRRTPHGEFIGVAQIDNHLWCQCGKCRALAEAEGSQAGPLLHFVNQVAEEIEQEFPDVLVTTPAYRFTADPPRTIRPRHNVVIRLCTDWHSWAHPFLLLTETERFQQQLSGWRGIHDNIQIFDYAANFSHYFVPHPNMPVFGPNLRYLVAHGITGYVVELEKPVQECMKAWVLAKLMWDPSRDTWSLMQDFIWGYYGKAAPAIAAYNEMLWRIWEEDRSVLTTPDMHTRFEPTAAFLSPEFISRAYELFDEAEALAENEQIRNRVQYQRMAIMYTELYQIYARYRDAGELPDRDHYAALLNRFRDLVRREGVTERGERMPMDELLDRMYRTVLAGPAPARLDEIAGRDGKVVTYRLPAEWRFAKDPDEVGMAEKWYASSWDDSKWVNQRVDLAVGWEEQGFAGYDGVGWYRQPLDVPAAFDGKHVYMYFGAVDEEAWVYIDGELAFEHSCASTGLSPNDIWLRPFAFDVTQSLLPGTAHRLAVRVRDSLNMGGIYKPVFLVASDSPMTSNEITVLLKHSSVVQ